MHEFEKPLLGISFKMGKEEKAHIFVFRIAKLWEDNFFKRIGEDLSMQ